ncbi:MAG TPA: hypothetical protein VIU46_09690 [Gallionellaceae bacterium]
MSNGDIGSGAHMVTVRRWTVVEVIPRNAPRSRHVWGHDIAIDEGCVSAPIVDFKMETMTVTTASGKQYRLAGLPGHSRKGQPVWEQWCKVNEVIYQREVTNDYMDPEDVSTRQFVALNDTAFSGKTE